jgi:hypothetical protein
VPAGSADAALYLTSGESYEIIADSAHRATAYLVGASVLFY